MSEVQEYKPMTTHELIHTIQRYQSDKSRSTSVQERWLAKAIQPTLDFACEVGNSRLEASTRKAVAIFRAAEIEAEIASKRKEIERLEHDLKTTAL